jgi:hypothetical protein
MIPSLPNQQDHAGYSPNELTETARSIGRTAPCSGATRVDGDQYHTVRCGRCGAEVVVPHSDFLKLRTIDCPRCSRSPGAPSPEQVGHGQELAGPAQAAMDKGDDDEQDTLLRKALTDLSPDERAVLIRKKAGFPIDEISDYYRKSAEAVEAQIERVRQVLRRLMRDRH